MALKVKFRTQFPAVVSATSPITLVKAGSSYTFGLNASAVQTTFDSIYGKLSGTLGQFSTTTSAQLAGIISDETGSGSLVFATSPTLVTPALGAATATTINKVTFTAPASAATLTLIDGTVLTGPAATGTVVTKTSTDTLTNKTFDTAGAGNSLSINGVAATANTGTGSVVRATSPTLVTPALGAATATTINGATIDNSAWTTYSPTITSFGGTITTLGTVTGRYKQIGKTVFVQVDAAITTAGTGSGTLQATLPFTAAAFAAVGTSRELTLTGKFGSNYIAPSATIMIAADATGTTYIANGARVIFTATYEIP